MAGIPGAAGRQPARDEVVVLRTPPGRLVAFFSATIVISAIVTLTRPDLVDLFALVVVLTAIALALRLRARVVLRPDRIDVVNLRRWQLPRAQVKAVTLGRHGPRGMLTVSVADANGSRELLALRALADPERVERQAKVVQQWWHSAG